jgi:hypothetical protein
LDARSLTIMPRRKAEVPTQTGDGGKAVPKKKQRTRQVSRSRPQAASNLPVDQQQPPCQEQQSRQDQQQQQPQRPTGTTCPEAEEDAPSEASTLMLDASSLPSRLTSSDVSRAAADPVVVGSMAGSVAASPSPKRQRSRKNSAAAPLVRRRPAAALSSDLGGQSANTAAPAASVVQHATVSPKTGRAKQTVARCERVFPKDIFFKRAEDAREALPQDLENRRCQYLLPVVGNLVCEFIGTTNDKNCCDILATDTVAFRWSYTCTPKPGIQIKGSRDSYHLARNIAVGVYPPKITRVILDAIVVAKLYERLAPELCPFVLKYCDRKALDVAGCEIVSIGFPKQVTQMPPIDDFIDASGVSAKWFRCASIGDTGKYVCHPGASARYSTNRLTYNLSELRMFSNKDKKESTPESFKLRKRKAICKDKPFPTNLDDLNSGSHRGVRDVIAYAAALAEFELAKLQERDISVAKAMTGFDLDPFAWEDSPGSNMVAVIWRSADGNHQLQTCNLRYLSGLVAKSNQKHDVEATDSIIEVI